MEPITMWLTLFLLLLVGGVWIIAWLVTYQRKPGHKTPPPEPDRARGEEDECSPPTPETEHQAITEQEGAPKEAGSTITQGAEQPQGKEKEPGPVKKKSQGMLEGGKPEPGEVSSEPIAGGSEPTSVEEADLQEVEKQQPTGSKRESPWAKNGRRKPVDRGGGPRGPRPPKEEFATQETASRRPKPEIVCWKREQQWSIGVEVAEDLLREVANLQVYQDGSPLSRDASREGCWRLNSICSEVTIQWNQGDGIEEVNLALGQDSYLLFKLSGEDLNRGRMVKSASSGWYLVVAPNSWERDEIVGGAPPVMPQPVALDGYSAHFFDVEKGSETRIVFRIPGGDSITVPLSGTQFELVGLRLEDTSERVGPLFSEPPRIRVLDTQAWKGVKTIVIGEEGVGRGKWRAAFYPDTDGQEQELPSEIRNRKGGWFFLRFYDAKDELIESTDFRFLCGLKNISVPRLSPLPSEQGHKPARVQLFHEPGIMIQATEDLSKIPIEREGSQTILTIPPNYEYDVTRWLVGYEDGPKVEVTILVERLWWSLGEEAAEPQQWEDKPLALSPDDLTAISKKALWLRFPKRRWLGNILVGFEQAKARQYRIKVAEKTLAMPLREFADAKEAMDQTQDQRFKVWIKRHGEEMEGVVAFIPAKPVALPPQRWVGIGRYKTTMARATLQHGSGNITINGSPIVQYFKEAPLKAGRFLTRLRELPTISGVLSGLDARVEVEGSNPKTTRQAKAVAHALARALTAYNPELKRLLKRQGFGGVKVPSMCWMRDRQ